MPASPPADAYRHMKHNGSQIAAAPWQTLLRGHVEKGQTEMGVRTWSMCRTVVTSQYRSEDLQERVVGARRRSGALIVN